MSARAETFNNHSSKMFTGAKTFVSRRDDKLGKHSKISARANTFQIAIPNPAPTITLTPTLLPAPRPMPHSHPDVLM